MFSYLKVLWWNKEQDLLASTASFNPCFLIQATLDAIVRSGFLLWWCAGFRTLPDGTNPQAVWSNINKSTADRLIQMWAYAWAHSANTHTRAQTKIYSGAKKYHSQWRQKIFWQYQPLVAQMSLLFRLVTLVLGFINICYWGHYQTLTVNEKQNKNNMPLFFPSCSVPQWRFPATFQVHYRALHWDYDKNTFFLPFWSDQGHFSLLFSFAISYQSSTWLNNLPLFKQLTSLAAKGSAGATHENATSILSELKTSRFVLFTVLSKPPW